MDNKQFIYTPSPGVGDPVSNHEQTPDNLCPDVSSSTYNPFTHLEADINVDEG